MRRSRARPKDSVQRRTPAEVALEEDPEERAKRLDRHRQGFKLRSAGKYRLSVNVSRELMSRVREVAAGRSLTINHLVCTLLERGLAEIDEA
jgi:hypothetical protein